MEVGQPGPTWDARSTGSSFTCYTSANTSNWFLTAFNYSACDGMTLLWMLGQFVNNSNNNNKYLTNFGLGESGSSAWIRVPLSHFLPKTCTVVHHEKKQTNMTLDLEPNIFNSILLLYHQVLLFGVFTSPKLGFYLGEFPDLLKNQINARCLFVCFKACSSNRRSGCISFSLQF